MKILGLIIALLSTGCIVTTDAPPRHQVYDCATYMYCDGYEEYEEFSVCATRYEADDVEDDFLYSCDNYGYYHCYYYECAADCSSTGLVCR